MRTLGVAIALGISLLCLGRGGTVLAAEPVRVAVAANFAPCAQVLVQAFGTKTGQSVEVSTAATGTLYAQISHGAPFDVLLAADAETPEKLEKEGKVEPGSRFTYAIGQLALWSATPNVVDGQGAVLKYSNFKHLAVANPVLAPYGLAAQQVLTKLGLLQALQAKIVTGENVAQVHQFLASGVAELGFVAWSQVQKDGIFAKGSGWLVPLELYRPLRQDAVVLGRGRSRPEVKAWVEFLRSEQGKEIIGNCGYRTRVP